MRLGVAELSILSCVAYPLRPLRLSGIWNCTRMSSPLSLREFRYPQKMMWPQRFGETPKCRRCNVCSWTDEEGTDGLMAI